MSVDDDPTVPGDRQGEQQADEAAERDAMRDLEWRRDRHRRRFYARSPKRVANVLAQLVQRKGYAQIRTSGDQQAAWVAAVGEAAARETEVVGIRRGTLEVLVGSSLLMQELTFRKEDLLGQLQAAQPEAGIKQIRFRIGPVRNS